MTPEHIDMLINYGSAALFTLSIGISMAIIVATGGFISYIHEKLAVERELSKLAIKENKELANEKLYNERFFS